MKLLRFETTGKATLGLLKDNAIVEIPASAGFPSMLDIIAQGDAALSALRDIEASASPTHKLDDVRLLAPLERPGKYLAIGMNYKKHIEEANKLGVETPKRQFWFNKQTSCISGPYDDIHTGVSEQVDYEVELGVVIGARAKHVSAADARKHIFGYVVANDVSARDWQFHSPTFTLGKSFDTHGPIGPWIVTADEIADCHNLDLRCFVNGEERQNSNTSNMIYNVYEQIEYLSTAFTLDAGDLIASGTPEGVGVGMDPQVFLNDGDVVRCEIDGIGAIESKVVRP